MFEMDSTLLFLYGLSGLEFSLSTFSSSSFLHIMLTLRLFPEVILAFARNRSSSYLLINPSLSVSISSKTSSSFERSVTSNTRIMNLSTLVLKNVRISFSFFMIYFLTISVSFEYEFLYSCLNQRCSSATAASGRSFGLTVKSSLIKNLASLEMFFQFSVGSNFSPFSIYWSYIPIYSSPSTLGNGHIPRLSSW